MAFTVKKYTVRQFILLYLPKISVVHLAHVLQSMSKSNFLEVSFLDSLESADVNRYL